jgi:hypothetical protein
VFREFSSTKRNNEMITIKGWTQRPDMCIISKAHEHIAAETAIQMIEAAKTGPSDGHIRMPGGMMLEYSRYPNGRIIIKQIA